MPSKYRPLIPTMTGNLLSLYDQSTALEQSMGHTWYRRAHLLIGEWAEHYGYTVPTVAAVTAALSPQISWERNLIIADDTLAGRLPSVNGVIRSNLEKARRIMVDRATDIAPYFPYGPKVQAFAANLAGDYRWPTIDTHGIQAALNDISLVHGLTFVQYVDIATAYVQGADATCTLPAEFQAIIWLTWKRRYPSATKRAYTRQWNATEDSHHVT